MRQHKGVHTPRFRATTLWRFAILFVMLLALMGCGAAQDQTGVDPAPTGAVTPSDVVAEDQHPSPASGPSDKTVKSGASPAAKAGEAAPDTADTQTKANHPQQQDVPANDPTVTLWVTRDFGRQALFAAEVPLPSGSDVLTLLKTHTDVETAYGGKFVNAINGVRSEGRGGRQDWLLWVNGSLSAVGAADCRPQAGDVVWWDYRIWTGPPAPAAVGAFPQPFLRRGCHILYPQGREAEAQTLSQNLQKHGVKSPLLAPLSEEGVARRSAPTLVVGLWDELDDCQPLAGLAARGPRAGAYCRLEPNAFTALDAGGHEAARHSSGSGIITPLASGPGDAAPVWLVTGIDEQGLARVLASFKGSSAFKQCGGLIVTPQGPTRLPL